MTFLFYKFLILLVMTLANLLPVILSLRRDSSDSAPWLEILLAAKVAYKQSMILIVSQAQEKSVREFRTLTIRC